MFLPRFFIALIRSGLPPLVAGLMVSCDSPQKQALRDLAAAGVEPSGKALVDASVRRDGRIVELLLIAKVHTEQRDTFGRTPLRIAVDNRDAKTATLLLGSGAGVNATTPDQTSVLGAAVATGETGLIETLVLAGASADGQMPGGEKILPWAIREGRLELVRMMMRAVSVSKKAACSVSVNSPFCCQWSKTNPGSATAVMPTGTPSKYTPCQG